MSHTLDRKYGRRGGHLRPGLAASLDGPPCDVCGQPMIAGQTDRHYVCSPPMGCCGYPSDLIADLTKHAADCETT